APRIRAVLTPRGERKLRLWTARSVCDFALTARPTQPRCSFAKIDVGVDDREPRPQQIELGVGEIRRHRAAHHEALTTNPVALFGCGELALGGFDRTSR